jgi:hypothetical protein
MEEHSCDEDRKLKNDKTEILHKEENRIIRGFKELVFTKAGVTMIGRGACGCADLANKLRFKINNSNSRHITFTLRNQTCPTVQMGNVDLPQRNEVK